VKKLIVSLIIVSFVLVVATAQASDKYDAGRSVGRHDNVERVYCVPEGTPTLTLALFGITALALTAVSLKRKKDIIPPSRNL
jgi:hypothetical protein